MVTRTETVSAAEVGSHLGVHPATVYRWAKAGSVPSISVGGRIRFDLVAVTSAITRHGGMASMGKDYIEWAKNTWAADLPNGVTIILAHPGQELNRDPKYLRENHGITPDMIIRLIDSRESPLRNPEDELAAAKRQLELAQANYDRHLAVDAGIVTDAQEEVERLEGAKATGARQGSTAKS